MDEFAFQRPTFALPSPVATTPTEIIDIVLNVKVKYNYDEIYRLIDELQWPQEALIIDDRWFSVFHLYTLHLLNDPIDMSNLTERRIYRPKLFVRKNDKFSPFYFHFLLNLFDIEYQLNNNEQFPEVWRTTFDKTNVTVNVTTVNPMEESRTSSLLEVNGGKDEPRSLLDVLKMICREEKYDEDHASVWEKTFQDEQIYTIDQLCNISDDSWTHLKKIPEVVKRLIIDYVKLNLDKVSNSFNQQSRDPYQDSKATLLADIHRVRRYFYNVIKKVDLISYLSRDAVDLAIEEVKKSYDDDGNILLNIQNYLRTFCLENRFEDEEAQERKKERWRQHLDYFQMEQKVNERRLIELRFESDRLRLELETYERHKTNRNQSLHATSTDADQSHVGAKKGFLQKLIDRVSGTTRNEPNRMRRKDEEPQRRAEEEAFEAEINAKIHEKKEEYRQKAEEYWNIDAKRANNDEQIKHLRNLLQIDWKEHAKKLTVKYGRGLLLFGPPGTGKSELLKRVAVYAGITMITQPLSAGELNRPYVGETEKLLVDIMSRANTIPYLICAMTIDEIDGLVPKRDNNAQQSKVDGISVLLSHIEGVKNIPNLIVFGATNRRNMMDEAFLRRMQAKVFVGRPSPSTRKHMLTPLIYKSHFFTSTRIDALVKITTNFSGAAVGALRSNIVVEMDRNPQINDRRLLELADTVAREFNVWFGISTLPSICRLNPNLYGSQNRVDHEENGFSLAFQDTHPSGRIVIDLQHRKCLIELEEENKSTIERKLNEKETSVQSLLGRLVQGCSSRNIDTIQVIDLNFLTKQNATEENQIFELLTTIFLECDEYNKSMLVFDIDSLIMLNKSDSEMSKSTSISNIRLYQFIREKCKTTIVERVNQQQTNGHNEAKPVEKWIVMIVKDNYLKTSLVNDIEFRKTSAEEDEEAREEKKRLDDERPRRCPKCFKDYLPKNTKFGDCHYHDGFIIDFNNPQGCLTIEQAQTRMQQAEILKEREENATMKTPIPVLVWVCCGQRYGNHQSGCRISDCGLPEELKESVDMAQVDYATYVQNYFMNNYEAIERQKRMVENFRIMTSRSTPVVPADRSLASYQPTRRQRSSNQSSGFYS